MLRPTFSATLSADGLVGLALAFQHGAVELPVLALHLGGERDARGFFRALGQDREFFQHEL